MHFATSFLSILALPVAFGAALPAADLVRRKAISDATLYAYGTNISGLPLFYSTTDGLLYIAPSNTTSSNLVSVTWDIPALTATTVTTNATTSNGTVIGALYVDASDNALESVGIVPSTGLDASINATTTGFGLFGAQLVLNSGGSIQAKFWAEAVSDSVWSIQWNSANTIQDNVVPLTIKTISTSTSS